MAKTSGHEEKKNLIYKDFWLWRCGSVQLQTPSMAEKGHFVLYSVDGKRFVLPLAYLKNNVVGQLLKLAEEEFGVQSNAPLTLPWDSNFMGYVISLVQSHVAKDVEKALLLYLASYSSRCASSS